MRRAFTERRHAQDLGNWGRVQSIRENPEVTRRGIGVASE